MGIQDQVLLKVTTKDYADDLTDCYKERYKIYCLEKKWLDANKCPHGLEKDYFDEYSKHIVIYNQRNEIKGYSRLVIAKQAEKLPIYSYPTKIDLTFKSVYCSEISRLISTDKSYGIIIIPALFRALLHWCMEYGIEYCYFVVEPYLLRFIKLVGFVFDTLSEPVDYFGGYTIAGRVLVKTSYDYFSSLNNEYGDWFIDRDPELRTNNYIFNHHKKKIMVT